MQEPPKVDGWFYEYTLCTMSGDHEIVLEKKAVQIPKMKKLDKHRIIGFLPQTGTPTSQNTPSPYTVQVQGRSLITQIQPVLHQQSTAKWLQARDTPW